MGTLPVTPTPAFIIFTSVMGFFGLLGMVVYLQRCWQGKETSFWSGMLAPMLPLPWHYALICLLWIVINSWLVPWILPVMGILLAALVIISLGKHPDDFWQLKLGDVSQYFKTSLGIFFIIIIPLQLVPMLSDFILTKIGIPIEPQPAIEKLLQTKNKKEILYFLLDALVVAPIWEEIVFRGFLYPLFKAKLGRKLSLLLTSFLFASVHFHLPTFFPLMFFGMILIWVYEKKGSLGYTMALHAIFNFFSACSIFLLRA